MTQNNLINQIVEVLTKHSKFAIEKNGKTHLNIDDVQAAATEIAALVNEDVVKEIDNEIKKTRILRQELEDKRQHSDTLTTKIRAYNDIKYILTSKQ